MSNHAPDPFDPAKMLRYLKRELTEVERQIQRKATALDKLYAERTELTVAIAEYERQRGRID